MNKIAVNPTQFITCRLCLDELGSYQIVPSVKEQIFYCFDINVEPFDGLPQLICYKCEDILNEFSKVKKKFTEKQEELRGKIVTQQGPLHENFSGAEEVKESRRNSVSENNKDTLKIPKKRVRIVSSSSSDLECSNDSKSNLTEKSARMNEKRDVSWTACYTKLFVCRICSLHCPTIKHLRNHITKRHGGLYKKHGYIMKRPCQVTLFKTDGKPNITGSRCVVYCKEKIVENVNADYHIIYTTKDYKDNAPHAKVQKIAKNKSHFSSDSSDNEIVVKHRKNKRLYSSSSSETVVLDSKPDVSDNDDNNQPSGCIDLDDCSETQSFKSMKPFERSPVYVKSLQKNDSSSKADQATIREIINFCRNKYVKKHYQDSNLSRNSFDIATKLQHKIFSIGRKVINKRIGVNCTPLLRFMEHKNLDIAWLPREVVNIVQDSNYIRIMPRRKNLQEKSEDNETGWVDVTPSKTSRTKSNKSNNSDQKNKKSNEHNENEISEEQSVGISDHMAVISEANLMCIETKKILNANPVANPKQLPKKFAANELKTAKISSKPTENIPQEDPDLCMPIITSTTSLAEPFSLRDNNDRATNRSGIDKTITEQQPPEAPRIKVKPVSELMSAETLNRLQHPTRIPITIVGKGLPLSIQNVTVPTIPVNLAPHSVVNHKQPNNNNITLIDPTPTWQNEFMVLDTVEFPNKSTNSPYLYLKQLLKIHGIILLDTYAELSEEFHCLIKFKVLYKQDIKNQPVILCLALFCSNNVFCFKVKDRNNENLDITKMSPNWQWEVLKIYKGEVVQKLLSSAQKIGQDVFESTNTFLCLLKSINIKQTL